MQDAFFQAAYCQPPKVLGRQLRPFSLSHAYLLRGLGNGFVEKGEGTRAELFTAALICSRTHEANARALFGGRQSSFWLTVWAAQWHGSRIAREREQFLAYLSDYLTTPEHWEDGDGSTFRAPWPFHFVHVLTRYYGCTLGQAWDMPVALARCYYDTWAEVEGDKTLVTEREHDIIRVVNAQ